MQDKTYLVNRVTTSNGAQLVAILYEELIGALKEAMEVMETMEGEQPSEVQISMDKGKDILAELLSTLEGKSEITTSLRSLYLFINGLMTEAFNGKDTTKLEEALRILNPLYEGWVQLGEEVQASSSVHQGTAKVTGFTYGKNQLNDYILEEHKWKKG